MSMFTNYGENSTTCPHTTNKECYSNRVPYAEYNANNELVGYYWYYGDTVDIQFDVTGEVTIEPDSIVYIASGDMPQENTVGYINQKAYNIVDYISWTCVAIIEDKYIWAEDEVFEAPDNGGKLLYISAKNFLKDMLYKICIYNGRYEPPTEKEGDNNNESENKSEVSEMSVFTHRFFQISEEPEAKKTIQNDSSETSAQSLNVGLGKAHADGNHLAQIKVNNFDHKNDANFIGDGDDPATNKINIPAILAARTAGGDPDPKTVHNGVNKLSNDVFKLKKLRDDEY